MTHTTLWNRNFTTYWLSIGMTALADALIFVALPFLVLELSNNPETLATAILLGSLPRFLGPLAGLLADRLHLKLPLLITGLLRTSIFAALGLLTLSGGLRLGFLYVAAFSNGLLTVFVFSASNVLLPKLVPETSLARANALLQAAVMGLPLAGYGIAGALVASVGTAQTVLTAAPLFLALTLAALLISFPQPKTSQDMSFLRDLTAGASIIFRDRVLRLAELLGLFLNFSLSVLNVLVPLVMEALGRGAPGYGTFEATFSGAILVGIGLVSLIGKRINLLRQVGFGVLLLSAGFAVLSAGEFVFLLGGAVALGLGLGMTKVASITLLQLIVPDGSRGKVLGTLVSFNAVGLSLGAAFAGQLAERVGMGGIFLSVAGVSALLSSLWFWRTAAYELAS